MSGVTRYSMDGDVFAISDCQYTTSPPIVTITSIKKV